MTLKKASTLTKQPLLLITKNPKLCTSIKSHLSKCSLKIIESFKNLEKEFSYPLIIDSHILTKEGMKEIRAIKEKASPPPILLLCAETDQKTLPQWLKEGIDDFLITTTLDMTLVEEKLKRLIASQKRDQQLELLLSRERCLKDEIAKLADEHRHEMERNQKKSNFIKNLSTTLSLSIDQLIQFSNIGLQRVRRKQEEIATDYFVEIKWISEELRTYIQDLQELSLLKSGSSEFVLEEVDIFDFLKFQKRQFQPIADSREITFTLHSDIINAYLLADYNKLAKVLNILLRNAFRYAARKGIVEIYAFQKKKRIFISVFDNGKGIPTEKQEQLFSMYNESNLNNDKRIKGFGLSICKELMLGQNGDITLENLHKNYGTRFVLSLPIAQTILD